MTSRKEQSIHSPARTQKRFGLLRLLVTAAIALLTLSGTRSALGEPKTGYTVLYNFTGGADGAVPVGTLIRDAAGNLYGTTRFGGNVSCLGALPGCGVVFKLDPTGKETVLYSFSNGVDGGFPMAGAIRDAEGNLYGTASSGGSFGCGVVFKLDPSGKETVLYSFSCGADGSNPTGALIRDGWGNLYGTAQNGGNFTSPICVGGGCGVVFKLDPSGKYTVLYTFNGFPDGAFPLGSLIRDEDGNLYSTTVYGGNDSCPVEAGFGCGVVFNLDPKGKETVLHTFCSAPNCADGVAPSVGLARDAAGKLYGTAGGAGSGPFGSGVVFKLDRRADAFKVLYTFTGGADGGTPNGLILGDDDGLWDPAGNLYGTTQYGGLSGNGVVFKLNPSGKETVLHTFNGMDGSLPIEEFLLKHLGSLYGTTELGGAYGNGVVFKLTLDDEWEHDQGDH